MSNSKYRQKHKAEIAAYAKAYYQKHKAEYQARTRAYYQKHWEEIYAKRSEYRRTHREEFNAKRREYYQKHREGINAKWREYYHRKRNNDASVEGVVPLHVLQTAKTKPNGVSDVRWRMELARRRMGGGCLALSDPDTLT